MSLSPNSKVQIYSHNIIHNKVIKFHVKDPRVIMKLYQFSHSNKDKIKKGYYYLSQMVMTLESTTYINCKDINHVELVLLI
jgi:hypothetical protein